MLEEQIHPKPAVLTELRLEPLESAGQLEKLIAQQAERAVEMLAVERRAAVAETPAGRTSADQSVLKPLAWESLGLQAAKRR